MGLEVQVQSEFESEDSYSILLFGGGALTLVYLATAIVGSIDSIPVVCSTYSFFLQKIEFPKLMQVVGLAYTFWFSTRYLMFKRNREELAAKIEEIKEQVLG
ncbi:unnamed protein product [Ilex paraguariensis]|uniref:Cyanobacterial aminoacyl-tRNA synthetase CAAD domain-containing protein n=1 Tax=Ilex paraguariensis TaxID=185542 RepID=A0ABC8SLK5_9AQUA